MSSLTKDRIGNFSQCLAALIGKQRKTREQITWCVFEETVLLQYFSEDVCPPMLRPQFGGHEPFVLASQCPANEEETDENVQYTAPLRTTQIVVCGAVNHDICPELQGAGQSGATMLTSVQEIDNRHVLALSIDDARQLISFYSAGCQQERSSTPWPVMWVASEGGGAMKFMYLACQEKASSSLLPGIVKIETLTARSCGSVLRPTSVLNSPPALRPLPTLQRMLSEPLSCLLNDEDLEGREMECFAEYDILGSQSFETTFDSSTTGSDSSVSSLQVRFAWNQAISLLATPPSSARCTMVIRVVPGDLRSPAAQLSSELRLIEHWLALCNAEEEVRESWRSGNTGAPAADRTECFIEEVQTRRPEDLMQWRPEQPQAELDAISTELLAKRKDLDFTELVWLLVKDAHSTADAVQCLLSISKALLHQRIQPMVYRDNMTLLARLVRRRLQCTEAEELAKLAKELFQKYKPEDLLEVVVQLGLYKLERDYIHFFLSEKLVTWEQLKPFLTSDNCDTLDYDVQLKWMHRLHACLELALTCGTFVSLPHDSLRELMRSALVYYANASSLHSPTFYLPLSSARACLNSCQNNLPRSWFASIRRDHSTTAINMVTDDDVTDDSQRNMDTMTRFSVSQMLVSS